MITKSKFLLTNKKKKKKKTPILSLVWLIKLILWFHPFKVLPGKKQGELSSREHGAVPCMQDGPRGGPIPDRLPGGDISSHNAGFAQGLRSLTEADRSRATCCNPLHQGNTPNTCLCFEVQEALFWANRGHRDPQFLNPGARVPCNFKRAPDNSASTQSFLCPRPCCWHKGQ